jgi:hypothetical protein
MQKVSETPISTNNWARCLCLSSQLQQEGQNQIAVQSGLGEK